LRFSGGRQLRAPFALVSTFDLVVAYLNAEAAKATQYEGAQAVPLLRTEDVDLLADMSGHEDVERDLPLLSFP